MCDTPFKTPLPYMRENSEKSDSEESTTSTGTGDSGSNYSGDLSIVAAFDDLIRLVKQKRADKAENAFLQFAEDVKDLWEVGQEAIKECRRLQQLLDKKTMESSELENALQFARKRLDQEKKMTKQAERERHELERKMSQIMDIFNQKENTFSQESKEKLDNYFSIAKKSRKSFDDYAGGQLSAIQEINSTGSILSDLSITKSEDNLDDSFKKHKTSFDGIEEPVNKKRRSSLNKFVEVNATDTVRATTTLTVPKEGPITATSVIESVPVASDFPSTPTAPPANLVFESWANQHSPRKTDKDHYRLHTLQPKTIVIPDNCSVCEKRIRFGKTALKCKDCRTLCHLECKSKLPVPCIPQTTTPNQKNVLGIISDYTPTTPPMVPGILIHCINEIELRGLNELGIYRIPGPERDVKMLKEKFLKGRGAPCLDQVDIHVICGTVKDFLRSLNESLITFGLWRDFVAAIDVSDPQDTAPALYHAISQLPQPNRDTLAYIVLHLQRISLAPECKMPIGNLSKIFGPTIVGYSCEDPNPRNLLNETKKQVQVMEALMNIPSEYWSTFVNVTPPQNNTLRQTPSTDSLLRTTAKGSIFTPNRNRMKRKQKFFATPPSYD